MVIRACRQTTQTSCSWLLTGFLAICMASFVQRGSATLMPASTKHLMNSSSIPFLQTSSALPCSCVVWSDTGNGVWQPPYEPVIVATVYETVVVRSNATLTTVATSYNSLWNTGVDYMNNSTLTMQGYTLVYPTEYLIIDDFSYDLCVSGNEIVEGPGALNLNTTEFPYMGVTDQVYIMPAPTNVTSAYTSFFELIGLPTTCLLATPDGAPFLLTVQSALTVTSTVSVSEEAAGAAPSTVSPMTSPGSYHLASATAMTTRSSTTSVVTPVIADASDTKIELPASESPSPSSGIPASHVGNAPPVIISLPDTTSTIPPPVLTILNSVIAANSISQYQYDTQVLTPGGQITVSGTTISLAPFGTALIVNGVTRSVTPVASSLPLDITIGGTVVAPNSAGAYTFGTQILSPGGQITVSGTPISLVPSATAIVVAGSTRAIFPAIQPHLVTVNGIVVTPNAASDYIIASQTLVPGGPAITISGTPYSLAPLAQHTTVADTAYITSSTDVLIFPTLTIDGSAITINAASEYIVGTQTIVAGGPVVTISGMPYSLAPSASFLVEGGSTESLAVQTSTVGLGGYIISGLGALPTGKGGGTNVTLQTGAAALSSIPCGSMPVWLFILGLFLPGFVW